MLCPMLTMYAMTFKTPEEYRDRECMGEACAWWDEIGERCAILEISRVLTAIGHTLGRLTDNLTLPTVRHTCYYCRKTITYLTEYPELTPAGWTRIEFTDGYYAWLCDKCSPPEEEEP